jgi:hypothetical protein
LQAVIWTGCISRTEAVGVVVCYALQVPNIALNPTLDGIQNAVNSTAKAILQVSATDLRHQCTQMNLR